jgi:CRP-like cAMP-binding protein
MDTTLDPIQELRRHPFVEDFAEEHIVKLAALAREVHFAPDQIIFFEGESNSAFYLLLSGNVALEIISPGHTMCMQTVGEGDELGWSSLLSDARRQFQARAITAVRALEFDGSALRHACEQQCAFGYVMMRRTLRVVADRLQASLLQLLDVYHPTRKAGP